VGLLQKPHLFLQLHQSHCVVVHGIPSPSPSDDGIVGRNDGRILSFVGFKEGEGSRHPSARTRQDHKAAMGPLWVNILPYSDASAMSALVSTKPSFKEPSCKHSLTNRNSFFAPRTCRPP